MITRFRDLYLKAPAPVKQAVRLIPFDYRMGSVYRRTLRFLIESDTWSHEQYRHYQDRKLSALLNLAIRNVPHYARYLRYLNRPAFEILNNIEPVTKDEIQRDLERFILPEKVRGGHYIAFTGGSSGHPLKMYLNNDVAAIEWAFMIVQWMRVGYRPGDKRVSFRGVEFREKRESTVRQNPVYNEILLSPFDMADTDLSEYVDVIRKQKPKFLRGYPSAMAILAMYIDQNNISDLPSINALLCGSESFTEGQRQLLERVFNTRFYSWYGMTEKVVLAGECEKSSRYHIFPQYGITEIINSRGNLSSNPGSEGEIVGTGFLNRAMPFIRYRLEDFASITGNRCELCGRNHLQLSKVVGHRVQDVIVSKSGSLISMTAINMHDLTFDHVSQFQFRQTERGKVTLCIKAAPGFDDENRNLILKSLHSKTRDDVDYSIEVVDRIDCTGIGKGVYLRQEIPGIRELISDSD